MHVYDCRHDHIIDTLYTTYTFLSLLLLKISGSKVIFKLDYYTSHFASDCRCMGWKQYECIQFNIQSLNRHTAGNI